MLRIMNIRPRLMGTLDICEMLLPVLGELVFEVYEDYIVTACTTIKLLVKNFNHVILTTVTASSSTGGGGSGYQHQYSPGIDVAREEREMRCRSCLKAFQSLALTLNELKTSPGHVGVTIRDTLSELEIMNI